MLDMPTYDPRHLKNPGLSATTETIRMRLVVRGMVG